jgi:hypothetical protein
MLSAAPQAERGMEHAARLRLEYHRDRAAHFRSLAEIEPVPSLRRHLHRLAAQHEELAASLEPIQEVTIHVE